jgi:hypothetical protein
VMVGVKSVKMMSPEPAPGLIAYALQDDATCRSASGFSFRPRPSVARLWPGDLDYKAVS